MCAQFLNELPKETETRRAILVGVELPKSRSNALEQSLLELEGLATTAHYEPVAEITQRLSTIHPKTFLGSGKTEELKEAVRYHNADVVILDENLSPGQNRNLEKILDCRVIDRSWLILEIFSDHARTREAKTQVDLAKLKYALPRLSKMWSHLSRQRGGIGMKEVGETQIQLDRRMIRNDIYKLERKLKQIDKEKVTQRKSRQNIYQVSLVGYTNVGKSSLMNKLTGAETLVENKLFATLDATTRRVQKNFPFPILLSDTVGLIDKLPHDLVASFKSTLDEVREADLLLKVTDVNHPDFKNQMVTTDRLLAELGVENTDAILVFNKVDTVDDKTVLEDLQLRFPDAVFISCRSGEGLDALRKAIVDCYQKRLLRLQLKLNYDQAHLIPSLQKCAMITEENYGEDEIDLDLRVDPRQRKNVETLLNGHAYRISG